MKNDMARIYTQYVDAANCAGIEFLVDQSGSVEDCWPFNYGVCFAPKIEQVFLQVKSMTALNQETHNDQAQELAKRPDNTVRQLPDGETDQGAAGPI